MLQKEHRRSWDAAEASHHRQRDMPAHHLRRRRHTGGQAGAPPLKIRQAGA